MTMSDPIADMLTRIRNANTVRHETVEMPASTMKKQIADILKREGFIRLTRGAEKSGKTSIAMKDPDTILSIIVLLLACLGLAALAQVIVS